MNADEIREAARRVCPSCSQSDPDFDTPCACDAIAREIEAAVAAEHNRLREQYGVECDVHCQEARKAVIEEIEEWLSDGRRNIGGLVGLYALRKKLAEMKGGVK